VLFGRTNDVNEECLVITLDGAQNQTVVTVSELTSNYARLQDWMNTKFGFSPETGYWEFLKKNFSKEIYESVADNHVQALKTALERWARYVGIVPTEKPKELECDKHHELPSGK
jgi:uncharacterized protein YllA (UPF0747 family)